MIGHLNSNERNKSQFIIKNEFRPLPPSERRTSLWKMLCFQTCFGSTLIFLSKPKWNWISLKNKRPRKRQKGKKCFLISWKANTHIRLVYIFVAKLFDFIRRANFCVMSCNGICRRAAKQERKKRKKASLSRKISFHFSPFNMFVSLTWDCCLLQLCFHSSSQHDP